MGVSKLVCSHLQLRHLMLLSQTEEPEVYPLSPAILEAENTLLDQSDRSTQIVLSIGPICLGLALSSSSFLTQRHHGVRCDVKSYLSSQSYLERIIQDIIK